MSENSKQENLVWNLGLVALVALGLGTRLHSTDAMVNVDMFYLWSKRIVRFMVAVQSRDFAETYQTHHPGVTFMWMAGAAWKLRSEGYAPLSPELLRLATLPVAIVGGLFPALACSLVNRALEWRHRPVAMLVGFLFASEPLFVAHSRNAHLDMLVTSFAWCAVLAACVARRRESMRWAVACGGLLGLALLTKLSAAGIALGIAAIFLRAWLPRPNTATSAEGGDAIAWQHARLLGVIAATSAAVLFVAWPALWVAPIETVQKLSEGLQREAGKFSEFMLFGRTGRFALPRWVYGVFLVLLVTPEFLIPAFAIPATWKRLAPELRSFVLDVVLAAIPLLSLLVGSSHVANRYVIPILPAFGIVSGVALVTLCKEGHRFVENHWRTLAFAGVALLVGLRAWRLIELEPLPITYCSSWTGVDCAKAFHLGWGEGLKEAAAVVEKEARSRGYDGPTKVFGSAYAGTMRVWASITSVKSLDDAQLLVEYLPDRQRRLAPALAIQRFVEEQGLRPIGTVELQGRTYVRIFPGPRH